LAELRKALIEFGLAIQKERKQAADFVHLAELRKALIEFGLAIQKERK
jgi:hypothetical protein